MSKPTKFFLRTSKTSRLIDFGKHAFENGFNTGLEELLQSINTLKYIDMSKVNNWRSSLKSIYSYNFDTYEKFDEIFDSFWLNEGRKKTSIEKQKQINTNKSSKNNKSIFAPMEDGQSDNVENDQSITNNEKEIETFSDGISNIIASFIENKKKTDLKEFVDPEDQKLIHAAVHKIARSIRHKRSRRLILDKKGNKLDLKKIVKKSIPFNGEPIHLYKKRKPRKPMKIVTILDISGSMKIYSQIFLTFVKGLVSIDQTADVYLFHTRLMRVTEFLKESDTLKAVNRISLLAEGFSGGTKIGKSLKQFNEMYSSKVVNGRTVVIIISDGYDTGDPKTVSSQLEKLKKRNCKIIWLNPLLGWENYEPVALSMKEASSYLDLFAPCSTIQDLENLEKELCLI
jgi:uncharacterized protein with von Willebrand factor type A (vWA) domain